MINIPELYKVFLAWYTKHGNTSTNMDFAWSCFLAGFQAQANENLDARFPVDEARINEREMWRGNRPGG
jgi:hypothetical protein